MSQMASEYLSRDKIKTVAEVHLRPEDGLYFEHLRIEPGAIVGVSDKTYWTGARLTIKETIIIDRVHILVRYCDYIKGTAYMWCGMDRDGYGKPMALLDYYVKPEDPYITWRGALL